jgi:uracil-DNA glycosylase family 4
VTHDDLRSELAGLTAALRAHAEWQSLTGATGLPRSTPELARSRVATESPATETPERTPTPSIGSEGPAAAPAAIARSENPRTEDTGAERRLRVLEEEIRACTRCRLHEGRTQTVFARGSAKSGLCFVGEGPGADEDAQGYPFVGKAGQLLDRMIVAMGFARDDVYVCNVVKCRPPNNRKPEPDEMESCRAYLEEQLDLVKPEVIVALGATAVQGLLGVTGGITRLRGEWRLYRGHIPVMPTFHPAYLLRQPNAKRDVWNDLKAVLEHMGRPVPSPSDPR